MQKDLIEFEEKLADFLGVKYAIGVANCTDGLAMSLDSVGIGPGDEVIFPSHTFVATAGAIHEVGGKGVPVECGSDHLIDPTKIEEWITPNTKAIMPVQLNGRVAQMDIIEKIATKHGLIIIEDAAQSLGAKYKGKGAGTYGQAAAFSFYPAKVLGCFGDGGGVVTNNNNIAEEIFACRDHGRNPKTGVVDRWGRNSRLDNIHAAVLTYFLDQYPEVMKRRREMAALYDYNLTGVNHLTLPPPPTENGDHFDIYQNYEIEANDRDNLQKSLGENNIGTLKQWGGDAVHQFKELGFDSSLPYTERMISRSFMVPLNMALKDDDINYVCNKIKKFYNA